MRWHWAQGADLVVTTAATTNTERHTLEENKSGFSVSTVGIGYSKGQEQQTSSSESVTQVGSVLTGQLQQDRHRRHGERAAA